MHTAFDPAWHSFTIQVEQDFPNSNIEINADLTQVQTVISAVLENSAEAIEGEGCIRITFEQEEIDETDARHDLVLKPGCYVCLTIEDDGRGMDEETRSKIFEPFFTTKFQGRGLAMAAAFGIVKNHEGWISVNSEFGIGTAVRIYLPAIERTMAEGPVSHPSHDRLNTLSSVGQPSVAAG